MASPGDGHHTAVVHYSTMFSKAFLFVLLIAVAVVVRADPGTIVRYRHHVVPVARYVLTHSHYHDHHDHHDHIDHIDHIDHHGHLDHYHYPDHLHYHAYPW
ncbi:uncharacterized protein [Periplaneta americana]|uniref:uncharacterized protein n=1 Tax=Periplaneta americana TaxID=6978 RepID=UPI0037E72FC2